MQRYYDKTLYVKGLNWSFEANHHYVFECFFALFDKRNWLHKAGG